MNLDLHKEELNRTGIEMFHLCKTQLKSAREAFFQRDIDLAEEVIRRENRVNALNLKIDRDCEHFLALNKPVAGDLRYVLALRKINFNLERMGDYAFQISKYFLELDQLPAEDLMHTLKLPKMFDYCLSMSEDIFEAFLDPRKKVAHKVFQKELVLNEINRDSIKIISRMVKENVSLIDQLLAIFTMIKKLEKVGDLVTNIAEEIIFYREAEILRHQKNRLEMD